MSKGMRKKKTRTQPDTMQRSCLDQSEHINYKNTFLRQTEKLDYELEY